MLNAVTGTLSQNGLREGVTNRRTTVSETMANGSRCPLAGIMRLADILCDCERSSLSPAERGCGRGVLLR
jgi:hypothetical protein